MYKCFNDETGRVGCTIRNKAIEITVFFLNSFSQTRLYLLLDVFMELCTTMSVGLGRIRHMMSGCPTSLMSGSRQLKRAFNER
jgi:hypothetical protein